MDTENIYGPMRLVLVVPMNGRLDDCYRVWERALDCGTAYYTVTDDGNNPLASFQTADRAMSDALARAA